MRLECCFSIGLALAVMAGPATARDILQPAELPPPAYAGQQYVDSRGCLFLRTGTPTEIRWISRVTRAGVPLCGYPPSGRRVPLGAEVGSAAAPPAEPPAATKPVADLPQATGGILVAVGSFSVTANAENAANALAGLGLPVAQRRIVQKGAALTAVYAGPFSSRTGAEAALKIIRGAGFSDALIVR